jgi:hypothetical protein
LADLPLNVSADSTFGIYLLDSLYKDKDDLLIYKGDYPLFAQSYGVFSEIEKGKYGIYSQVENAVYHYSDRKLEKKYSFAFKNVKSIASQKGVDINELNQNELANLVSLDYYKESKTCILLIVNKGGIPVHVMYNKISDSTSVAQALFFNKCQFFHPIISDTPGIMVSSLPENVISWLKESEAEDRIMISDTIYNLAISQQEDDNPILEIFYLKK